MPVIDSLLPSNSIRWVALIVAAVGLTADLLGQAIPESRTTVRTTTGRRPVVKQTAGGSLTNEGGRATRGRLPNPVRQADYGEPLGDPPPISMSSDSAGTTGHVDTGASSPVHESSWGFGSGPSAAVHFQPPKHTHKILRAPGSPAQRLGSLGQTQSRGTDLNKLWVHPPYSSHRRRIQPQPAMLPGGKERGTWKSPYSYGYFGASGTRHWSLHHGYRDRYTEWRLK